MSKAQPWFLLLAFFSFLIAVSFRCPVYLSDEGNAFLRDFLDNDILSVLGFITAVGVAAILSIVLHLNELEDATGFSAKRTRRSLELSAVSFIFCFALAFVSVVLKPVFGIGQTPSALFNSFSIVLVLVSASILLDLTRTVFAIPTRRKIMDSKSKRKQD